MTNRQERRRLAREKAKRERKEAIKARIEKEREIAKRLAEDRQRRLNEHRQRQQEDDRRAREQDRLTAAMNYIEPGMILELMREREEELIREQAQQEEEAYLARRDRTVTTAAEVVEERRQRLDRGDMVDRDRFRSIAPGTMADYDHDRVRVPNAAIDPMGPLVSAELEDIIVRRDTAPSASSRLKKYYNSYVTEGAGSNIERFVDEVLEPMLTALQEEYMRQYPNDTPRQVLDYLNSVRVEVPTIAFGWLVSSENGQEVRENAWRRAWITLGKEYKLWDATGQVNVLKIIADMERIIKLAKEKHNEDAEAETKSYTFIIDELLYDFARFTIITPFHHSLRVGGRDITEEQNIKLRIMHDNGMMGDCVAGMVYDVTSHNNCLLTALWHTFYHSASANEIRRYNGIKISVVREMVLERRNNWITYMRKKLGLEEDVPIHVDYLQQIADMLKVSIFVYDVTPPRPMSDLGETRRGHKDREFSDIGRTPTLSYHPMTLGEGESSKMIGSLSYEHDDNGAGHYGRLDTAYVYPRVALERDKREKQKLVCSFDFETFNSILQTRIGKTIAYSGVWAFYNMQGQLVKEIEFAKGLKCVDMFLRSLEEMTRDYSVLCIGQNNARFDNYLVLEAAIESGRYSFSEHSVMFAGNKLLQMKIAGAVFKDLYRFTMMGLKTACIEMNIPQEESKTEFDHWVPQSVYLKGFETEKLKQEVHKGEGMACAEDCEVAGINALMAWVDENEEVLRHYNVMDVVSTHAVYKKYNDSIDVVASRLFPHKYGFRDVESDIVSKPRYNAVGKCLTVASLAYKLLFATFSKEVKEKVKTAADRHYYHQIRDTIAGGRCQMLQNGGMKFHHQGRVVIIDVVSLYPSILNQFFPIGKPIYETEEDRIGNRQGVVKVTINHQIHKQWEHFPCVLPNMTKEARKLGTLDWDYKGEQEGVWITTVDRDQLTKYYGRDSWKFAGEAIVFDESQPIIFGYMSQLYKFKQHEDILKANKDPAYSPAMRCIYKLLMNSALGKFIQRGFAKKYYMGESPISLDDIAYDVSPGNTTKIFEHLNDDETSKYPQIIGVFVYSHARKYMFDTLFGAGFDKENVKGYEILYTDTDSAFMPIEQFRRWMRNNPNLITGLPVKEEDLKKLFARAEDMVEYMREANPAAFTPAKELGQFEVEGIADEMFGLAPKTYLTLKHKVQQVDAGGEFGVVDVCDKAEVYKMGMKGIPKGTKWDVCEAGEVIPHGVQEMSKIRDIKESKEWPANRVVAGEGAIELFLILYSGRACKFYMSGFKCGKVLKGTTAKIFLRNYYLVKTEHFPNNA